MSIPLPMLDRAPSGRPHDYQFLRIQEARAVMLEMPASYKNPYVSTEYLAKRDQSLGGTCCGQSGSYIKDIQYLTVTKDFPTAEDRAQYQKDVTDVLGTLHDVLYPNSTSSEGIYQMSRKIGGVTYPSGSEIRFVARALKDYGANLESQWHSDKRRTKVWDVPHKTDDGGLDADAAATFAADHVIDGWAMCGRSDGYATWDQVKYSIFTKGVVLAAIPVYENYTEMQGGDGTFPDPRGEITGYHALCFYGYDEDNLYLIHSWGDFCGWLGKISRRYFEASIDQSVWMVLLDETEKKIGDTIHRQVPISCNVPALISVDGVTVGTAPVTIACEPGKAYSVMAALEGYVTQVRTVSDGVDAVAFTLEAVAVPSPAKSWWESLIEWLINLFKR